MLFRSPPHDGVDDFKLSLVDLTYKEGGSVQNVAGQFQDVELQVPAPIPFLGAAAAFGSIRKARKFSSLLKVTSKA